MDSNIRPAKEQDLPQIILCLKEFSSYCPFSPETKHDLIQRTSTGIYTFVYVENSIVLGTISYFLEKKLHNGGKIVLHLEDLGVLYEHQSKGIGGKLVEFVCAEARRKGCYKIILDCKGSLINYYARFGFFQSGVSMRKDF